MVVVVVDKTQRMTATLQGDLDRQVPTSWSRKRSVIEASQCPRIAIARRIQTGADRICRLLKSSDRFSSVVTLQSYYSPLYDVFSTSYLCDASFGVLLSAVKKRWFFAHQCFERTKCFNVMDNVW